MKNEQRKKNTQNELAQMIEGGIGRIKPHSAMIMRAIMIILIAVLLFLVWQKFAAGNRTDFHNDIKQLTNSYNLSTMSDEQLETLVTTYTTKYPSGANNAHISLLLGNICYNIGSTARTQGDREKAVAHYEKSLEYYQTADSASLKQRDLAESAVWGLAQSNEVLASLKEGKYSEEAVGAYARLLEKWPSGIYADLAKQRSDFLKRPGVAAFMTKYRESDAKEFAPNFQIPGSTEPSGDIDTTIIPGGFETGGLLGSPENNESEIEHDPGLTLTKPEEPTTDEPATVSEPAPETTETPQPADTNE